MAGDDDSPRRTIESAESSNEDAGSAALANLRRVALVVLPLAVAASVLMAYQNRSGVEDAGEDTTQAVAATAETSTLVATPTEGEGSGESGTEAEGPELADEAEAGSEQAEFSASGPNAAPESTSADTLDVTVEINWSLGSGGSSTSTPFLPLNGTVQNIELPNYDQDQDDDPGRTVQIGDGLDDTDPAKNQRWLAEPGELDRLEGRPTLELWLATKDFDTDKSGRVVAGLYECSGDGGDCNLLADGDTIFNQSAFGEDFGRVTVNMSELSTTIGSERALLVKLAVDERSEADLWLAYGTTTYRTFLSVR